MKRGQSGINCLIALHKPKGITSHDCINALRSILHERRIGHAGTLDPLADGVLLIGIGQATRLLSYIVGHDKSYEASITFGQQTTTDDTEGDVCASSLVPACVAITGRAQAIASDTVFDQPAWRSAATKISARLNNSLFRSKGWF